MTSQLCCQPQLPTSCSPKMDGNTVERGSRWGGNMTCQKWVAQLGRLSLLRCWALGMQREILMMPAKECLSHLEFHGYICFSKEGFCWGIYLFFPIFSLPGSSLRWDFTVPAALWSSQSWNTFSCMHHRYCGCRGPLTSFQGIQKQIEERVFLFYSLFFALVSKRTGKNAETGF